MFFQDRLKPAVVRMKELIDAGRLGTPVLASGHVKRGIGHWNITVIQSGAAPGRSTAAAR